MASDARAVRATSKTLRLGWTVCLVVFVCLVGTATVVMHVCLSISFQSWAAWYGLFCGLTVLIVMAAYASGARRIDQLALDRTVSDRRVQANIRRILGTAVRVVACLVAHLLVLGLYPVAFFIEWSNPLVGRGCSPRAWLGR